MPFAVIDHELFPSFDFLFSVGLLSTFDFSRPRLQRDDDLDSFFSFASPCRPTRGLAILLLALVRQ